MKVAKSFIVFVFCLISFTLLAQNEKMSKSTYDRKTAVDPDYSSRLKTALSLPKEKSDQAIATIQEVLAQCITANNQGCVSESYEALGDVYQKKGQNAIASQQYEKALQANDGRDPSLRITNKLIKTLVADAQYQEANVYLRIAEQQSKDKTPIRIQIADNYLKLKQYQLAETIYLEELKIAEKANKTTQVVALSDSLGKLYYEKGDNKQSQFYYNKALKLSVSQQSTAGNTTPSMSKSKEGLSNVYRREKRYDEELTLRQESAEEAIQQNDVSTLLQNNIEIGKIYIEKNEEDKAIPYLERSIKLSDSSGDLTQKKEAHKYLSEAYAGQRRYDKAFENYKAYVELHDSLLRKKETELTTSLVQYKNFTAQQGKIIALEKDIALNQQLIDNFQKDQKIKEAYIRTQRLWMYLLIAGILSMVAITYFMLKSSRQKRIANQLLALKSLRSQMNPHFIFNSLNSINHYIMNNDEKAANKYLADFSRLMRSVMENSEKDFVSLSTEIEVLERYIRLEHQRFADKFSYSFEVDEMIDADRATIPPMIIQPYIENAVWHGLRYLEDRKGILRIAISPEGEKHIRILIEDNGIGRKKSEALKTKNQRESTSTGMRNIRERLNIMNEIHHTLMKVQVEDLPNDSGTRVEIRIPIHSNLKG